MTSRGRLRMGEMKADRRVAHICVGEGADATRFNMANAVPMSAERFFWHLPVRFCTGGKNLT